MDFVQTYYPNKQVHTEYFTMDGEKHGVYNEYFPCGSLKTKSYYNYGDRYGIEERYHLLGDKCTIKYKQAHYINGKLDGVCYELDSYRENWICTFYIKGVQVGYKYYMKQRCYEYKEELISKVLHPDRIERLANKNKIDPDKYIDIAFG